MKVYALHGYWNFEESDGSEVVEISTDYEKVTRKMDEIVETKASCLVLFPYKMNVTERTDRMFEMEDDIMTGGYAKFYITEHDVEIPVEKMYEISRNVDECDRANDVREYLKNLYEGGNIEDWKYEYMANNKSVVSAIVHYFEKIESCNTPFNTTMEIAVEHYMSVVVLDDNIVKFLWERFGSIPVDDDGILEDDFMQFDCGESREEVFRWFDDNYSKGVGKLMNGGK